MASSLWKIDPRSLPGPLKKLAEKELHQWVGGWLRDRAAKMLQKEPTGTRHLLFAVCDHYEPLHGNVSRDVGVARVAAWRTRYPEMAQRFRDSSGRPPRHSYFFPGEQYDGAYIEPLGEMCEMGLGEVEVHLHHDGDTRDSLRASLEKTLDDLGAHGVMSKKDQRFAWSFIHGNWCLANARRDGRWCGVDDEMTLLYELGCYADFTFPSAPDQCQPGIVNSIYYPVGDVARRRAYEHGEPVKVGSKKQDRLLMIEGPIALARRQNKKPGNAKKGSAMRIESAALDKSDPPSPARLETWIEQKVGIEGRPDLVFVKVHTHGAPEGNADVMLGEPMTKLHEALAAKYNDGTAWKLHYVTAREMYNVARAAMDAKEGSPTAWFDYEVPPPARAGRHQL
jgi:hypothetical protein